MFTITNEHQIPAYISSKHFHEWHTKCNTALRAIGLPEYEVCNLNITFSDEEEKSYYGSLAIDELKDLIRENWGKDEKVEKILEKINSYEDYRNMIQELMRAIVRIRESKEKVPSPELLHVYLEDMEFEVPVLGRYSHNHRTIILFTKNIENAAVSHDSMPLQEFERVFIHELFHAYHYMDSRGNDREELVCRRDYTCKVVKESLAAAFEWNYCLENKIACADDLPRSWDAHSVLVYPYSGAAKLLTEGCRLNRNKFYEVFAKSLSDMDGALRLLLDSYDFYKIKNAVQMGERVVVKKAFASMSRADFDAKMRGKRVGEIAQEEIPPIVAKKPHLAYDLLDEAYSSITFGIPVAVLSATQAFYPCGDRMYYTKTKAYANGKEYYLFMHWREKYRENLLNWIWKNRV